MEAKITNPTRTLPPFTQDLVRNLAFNTPGLGDLTPEQAEAVARSVLGDYLKGQMKTAVLSAKIDFNDEVSLFLADQRSPHTTRTYKWALGSFETWLTFHGLHLAEVTPAQADTFIRDEKATGNDSDTVRLKSSAVSSFYGFLERRYTEIRNPFRGTRVRPKESWATATIPMPHEIDVVLAEADPKTKVAVAILVETGMRVGALAELRIWPDGRFATTSKGKRFEGFEPLTKSTRGLIKTAGLASSRPFSPADHLGRGVSVIGPAHVTMAISTRINRLCRSLARSGKISAPFSPHDFRHAFAEANSAKGLVWLRDRLGHSSVSVTERYLRNTLGKNTASL